MRNITLLIAAFCFLFLPASWSSAQSQSATPDTSGKDKAAITLPGCVSAKPESGNFTFTAKDGTRYRLIGKNLKKYAGQEVEIIGGPGKKLTVKGGLQPSPNAAAQAGAMDPTQAFIASQPGGGASGTGAPLPEFSVNQVRASGRSCQ